MPDYQRYRRRPRPSTKALTVKLVALGVAATLAIGGLIAAEMAAGDDPGLGPKAKATKKSAATAAGSRSSTASSVASGTDPYSPSSGYSYGSGSSGYSSAPSPVTSSTS
jgi:hypothetical protein